MNKYIQDIKISCFETDVERRFTLTALLNRAQEIACRAADELNFGFEPLREKGVAWVLSRQHFDILQTPHWTENVKLYTWHKGIDGPFFLRDFRLEDENGVVLALGTSSWLILDLESRSLVRNEKLTEILPSEPQCTEDAIQQRAPKVVMPRGVEAIAAHEHTVVYSDIDTNRHVNNVKYTTWAMDCIEPEVTMTKPARSFDINFVREAHLGDTVTLMRTCIPQEDGGLLYYVQGIVNEAPSFICRILF